MPRSAIDLSQHNLVALSRTVLTTLRAVLLRDADSAGPAYLQEAGYAGGEAVFQSFREWLRGRIDGEPGELTLDEFGELASDYFHETGWGRLEVGSLHGAVATVDSPDWSEADPAAGLGHPGCYVTTGMLAGFFGHIAGAPLAVLEVECRSMGAPRCRFLLGAGEVMSRVYDEVERGVAYEEALAGVE